MDPKEIDEINDVAELKRRLRAALADVKTLQERGAQQLAACECAAIANTEATHESNKVVTRDNPFWSPAFESVMRRTAECIELRKQVATLSAHAPSEDGARKTLEQALTVLGNAAFDLGVCSCGGDSDEYARRWKTKEEAVAAVRRAAQAAGNATRRSESSDGAKE